MGAKLDLSENHTKSKCSCDQATCNAYMYWWYLVAGSMSSGSSLMMVDTRLANEIVIGSEIEYLHEFQFSFVSARISEQTLSAEESP